MCTHKFGQLFQPSKWATKSLKQMVKRFLAYFWIRETVLVAHEWPPRLRVERPHMLCVHYTFIFRDGTNTYRPTKFVPEIDVLADSNVTTNRMCDDLVSIPNVARCECIQMWRQQSNTGHLSHYIYCNCASSYVPRLTDIRYWDSFH